MTAEPTVADAALRLADVEPIPGVAKPDPILVVDGIERSFGGLQAVAVHHLEVERCAITSLIGPNGAGKTTFFNLLTGFDRADRGSVRLDGRRLETVIGSYRRPFPAYAVARRGMVRTFQLTKVLSRLSVLDNMRLGAPDQGGESMVVGLFHLWGAQETRVTERAEQLLDRFGLGHMRDDMAGTLSGGQRKLLEMARALMAEPSIVLFDEPMAGVNPALVESLLDHIKALPAEGVTVVFVEHDMDVVMDISDWVVCMAEGRILAEGPPASVAGNPDVIEAYLGTDQGAVT